MNIFFKSKRLFFLARLQGMFAIIIDSDVARPSSSLLFYSIVCAITVTVTLQWALYKLFARLYSNTKQEIVLTILVTSKYAFLEWKVIFGYFSQIVQRNDIAAVLNEATKIDSYFKKFRMNHRDNAYRNWCLAKGLSNWFQVLSIGASFVIGCLMYTKNVALGDVVVFIITTYCQIMPTTLSSMYFFYLAQAYKFYRAINRKILSLKCGKFDHHRVDQLNYISNVVTAYTENVCRLFSVQILASLFYASALILVELFFIYYNIQKFRMNKYLFELYGDLLKNFGLISCFVVEIYFICTITDLVMSEAERCASTIAIRNSWRTEKRLCKSMEMLYLTSLNNLPNIYSCGLFRIDRMYILPVLTSILSQAIIIIQFKVNESNGKPLSGYRSGWNMEGLMENKILNLVTTEATMLQKDRL